MTSLNRNLFIAYGVKSAENTDFFMFAWLTLLCAVVRYQINHRAKRKSQQMLFEMCSYVTVLPSKNIKTISGKLNVRHEKHHVNNFQYNEFSNGLLTTLKIDCFF